MERIKQALKLGKKKSDYSSKAGHDPGELTYIGEKEKQQIKMKLIQYDQDSYMEYDSFSFSELTRHFNKSRVNWIDVEGISDTALIQEIATHFDFHPLMTEDILNSEHLPKSEEYESHHFFTLKMMKLASENNSRIIKQEHLSLVLGRNFLITFQDLVEGDVFENVRTRTRASRGRIRKNGADYLYYVLIDSVIDQYFIIMEYLKEIMEDFEDDILSNPSQNKINDIIRLKRELTNVRRVVYPVLDAVEKIFIEDYPLIDPSTITYFRDIKDHVYHLVNMYDSSKETIASLMDMYLSNLSHSLNSTMKALTMISFFFVPLTFIAGVYGMNFEFMPELKWKLGYPFSLAIMLGVFIAMFLYLRRKRWL